MNSINNVIVFSDYARTVTDYNGVTAAPTAQQLLNRLGMVTLSNVAAVNVTLPAPSAFAAAQKSLYNGISVGSIATCCLYRANAAGTTTFTANGNILFGPALPLAAGQSIILSVEFTNVTAGTEACNIYYGYGAI